MSKPFLLLPAVDIAAGLVKRPQQGEINDDASYGKPELVVGEFVSAGASWIHIVDLDLAFKNGNNQSLIAETIHKFPLTNFQISGGIADAFSFEIARESGSKRINLASQSLEQPEWLASLFEAEDYEYSFALDFYQGRVVARGTKSDFGELSGVLSFLADKGCKIVSVTDVERDGMLNGPNLELLTEISQFLGFPVISSGGIGALEHLDQLLASEACSGAILGKAIYSQSFTLPEAIDLVS